MSTLDQVIASLGSVYQPQIDAVYQQQAALPAQFQAQEQGLNAQKDAAFGDIVNGARSRGLGFSGIPLADQAKYTATNYLPALANLKTAQTQQSSGLADTINKINENRFNQANNIWQYQTSLDENKRQFDAQQRASAANSFSPTYGGGGGAPTTDPQHPTQARNLSGSKSQQDAYNAIQALMQTRNTPLIAQTYNAIASSAAHGNTYDQTKLQLLHQLYQSSLDKNGIGKNPMQFNGGGQPTNIFSYGGNAPLPIPVSAGSSGNIRF